MLALVEMITSGEMSHFQWAVASEVLHEAVILLVTIALGFTFLKFGRIFGEADSDKPTKKKVSKRPPSPTGSRATAPSQACATSAAIQEAPWKNKSTEAREVSPSTRSQDGEQ